MTTLTTKQFQALWRLAAEGGKCRAAAQRLKLPVAVVKAVREALNELGIGRRPHRRFTPLEREIVKRDYRRVPTARLAAQLRCEVAQLYRLANRLGLAQSPHLAWPSLEPELRRLHAEGWTDAEMARHFAATLGRNVDRKSVEERRWKLGLPSNAFHERFRRRVAAKTREQLAKAGLKSLAELRKVAWAQAGVRCGWPADLRPRAVQMLNALYERGPMTRFQIAQAIGMPWKGSRNSLHSNDRGHGTYLSALMERGLVIRLPRLVRGSADGSLRRGANQHVYMLAPDVKPAIRDQKSESRSPRAEVGDQKSPLTSGKEAG